MNNNIMYKSNENGQRGSQAMKAVRSTRQVVSKVHAIVGGALFGVGVLVFALYLFFDHQAAVLSLMITGGTLIFSGAVELLVSFIFHKSVKQEQTKLARLKAEGQSFAGEVIRLQRHFGVSLWHSFSVYAECSYKNHEGKTCLVKSASFLHESASFQPFLYNTETLDDSFNDCYAVWVYVNPRDPWDYALEVFAQTTEAQGDYDYR